MNPASHESASGQTGHRILLQQPVAGPEGFSTALEARANSNGADTYLALHSRNNDIVIYFGIQWDAREVILSRRTGDEWLDKMTRPAACGDGQLKVAFTVRPGAILVRVGDEAPFEWRVEDFQYEVFSLHASGCWTVESAGSSDAEVILPEEVLPDLPLASQRLETLRRELIFDFGMHNGDDTAFYLRKGFHVVAVEANPTLCALGAKRFAAEIAEGRLTICNIGVAPVRGELTFYVNKGLSEWSSFDRAIASRGHPVAEVKVRTARPEDFFTAFGVPYFCKIDIEGYDRLVVEAVAKIPVKPCYVSFENGALRDFELLAGAGYDAFQLVEQSVVPQIKLPDPSPEGLTVSHEFPPGSSGPFGRDLAGDWHAVEETKALLERHHREVAARAERGYDWWDLHARHRQA